MSTQRGEMIINGDETTLAFVRQLPFPIETVWAAIADPEERAQWFGETILDGQVGGSIEMVPNGPPLSPERKKMTGRILRWDPPYLLEHEWRQSFIKDGIVRYELEPDGENTILRFSHSGLSTKQAQGFGPGTHAFLDRLGAYLNGDNLPGWQAQYRQVAAESLWRISSVVPESAVPERDQ